jgi:glutaredoxin 3
MIHHQHPVALYTIGGCPYCKKAIRLLKQLRSPYKVKNIGSDARLAIQLYRETGTPTVPKIFINGQFIGGSDQLQRLADSGQLFRAIGQ